MRLADLSLERAKRLVESGKDVLILMDSITRATRAYNLALPTSGRTLSGGIDPVALYPPKKFFRGCAQRGARGKSDDNRQLPGGHGQPNGRGYLRGVQGYGEHGAAPGQEVGGEADIPAIDIGRSSTRREELMFDAKTVKNIWLLRRIVGLLVHESGNFTDGIERILERLSPEQEQRGIPKAACQESELAVAGLWRHVRNEAGV